MPAPVSPAARRAVPAALVVALLALAGPAPAAPLVTAGEYELTAQTVLPHLEEALRYATTRTRQCLHEPDPTALFPLLQHPAFAGCRLQPDAAAAEGERFVLQCANPGAASGTAVVEADATQLSALLELKMGGKNMTLSQRLHGPRLGACPATPR